jgi:hypothetical protein
MGLSNGSGRILAHHPATAVAAPDSNIRSDLEG